MATESAGSTSTSSLVKSLQQASGTEKKASKGDIGKNEFLNMLVTQLKNQDPLDPMDGDQFAVDLAQFSQVAWRLSAQRFWRY
jgi:flagellar basal-body rod modification protein FlgD